MLQKTIGKEYSNKAQREAFLKDNCDRVEEKGYMKPYTPEELQEHKEKLANLSIEIEEIEDEKKAEVKHFNETLKPLADSRRELLRNIRQKAEYVREICYKFTDREERQTAYYNSEGDLIELRPASADELNLTIFSVTRDTGTND
jgi:predicted phage tail protein